MRLFFLVLVALALQVVRSAITLSPPSTVLMYTPFTVSWTNTDGATNRDSIALYSVSMIQGSRLLPSRVTSNSIPTGQKSGSVQFQLNDFQTGMFYAVYITGSTAVQTSANINVILNGFSVTTSAPDGYNIRQPFKVYWAAPVAHSRYDSIRLVRCLPLTSLSSSSLEELAGEHYNGKDEKEEDEGALQAIAACGGGEYESVSSVSVMGEGFTSGNVVFQVEYPSTYVAQYYLYNINTYVTQVSFIVGYTNYGFGYVPANAAVKIPFSINWVASEDHSPYDNIRLMKVGSSSTYQGSQQIGQSGYDQGTVSFSVDTPGVYWFTYVLYSRDLIILTSPNFTVGFLEYSVQAPSNCNVGTPLSVTWFAPEAHSRYDEVFFSYVYPDGTTSLVSRQTVDSPGLTSGKMTFTPYYPGNYVLQYNEQLNSIITSTTLTSQYVGFGVEITSSQLLVEVDFVVTWSAPAAHSKDDTVRLMRVLPTGNLTFATNAVPVTGATTGTLSFRVRVPGVYVAEYWTSSAPNVQSMLTLSQTREVFATNYNVVPQSTQITVVNPFVVTWSASANHYTGDQIALVRLFSSGPVVQQSVELVGNAGTTQGTTTFTVTTPGVYAVRYQLYASSYGTLVQSQPFTVIAAGFGVKINSDTYGVSAPITVFWTAPVGHSNSDVIRLLRTAGDGSVTQMSTQNVLGTGFSSGNVTFVLQTVVSNYFFQYQLYADKSIVATTSEFGTVSQVGLVVPTQPIPVGSLFEVTWSAPITHSVNDAVGLYFLDPQTQGFVSVNSQTIVRGGYPSGVVRFTCTQTGSYVCAYILYSDKSITLLSSVFQATTNSTMLEF